MYNSIQTLVDIINEQRSAKQESDQENLQEAAYDRNKMGQLGAEATRLTKDLNSLTEKYGVKKGAILMVSQLEAILGKMNPEDLKNYKETQMKLVKVNSDIAKMTNAYQPTEKYPLGGRDEKSGRSYSESVVTEAALSPKRKNKILDAVERLMKKDFIKYKTAPRVKISSDQRDADSEVIIYDVTFTDDSNVKRKYAVVYDTSRDGVTGTSKEK